MIEVILVTASLLWPWAFSVSAADAPPQVTKAELREMVYSNDILAVEMALHQAQQDYLAGKVAADDLRALFSVFATTKPETIEFTRRWVAQNTGSPYANTAHALALIRLGDLVRGNKPSADTYADALRLHHELYNEAYNHAIMGNFQDERLLPASDALLASAKTEDRRGNALEVLDRVMGIDPNWGTLERALQLTVREDGIGSDIADALCAYYGNRLHEPVNDMVRYCRISAIYRFDLRNRWEELNRILAEEDDRYLDTVKARLALMDRGRTDRQAAFLRWYFETYPVRDIDMARDYDLYVALRYGYESVETTVVERAKAAALAEKEHDPYNPELLDVLTATLSKKNISQSGALGGEIVWRPSDEEKLDVLKRKLSVTPFEPELWQNTATTIFQANFQNQREAEGLLEPDPYWINAIVYSGHDPEVINSYLSSKLWQLQRLRNAQEMRLGGAWETVSGELDMYGSIYCPMLQAKKVLADTSAAKGLTETGLLSVIEIVTLQEIEAQAKQDGECARVLDTDAAEALMFEPVAVDLGFISPIAGY